METINANDYMTIADVAGDAGVTQSTVHNWIKYYRYLTTDRILGRLVIRRDEWAAFKESHPELIGKQAAAA